MELNKSTVKIRLNTIAVYNHLHFFVVRHTKILITDGFAFHSDCGLFSGMLFLKLENLDLCL